MIAKHMIDCRRPIEVSRAAGLRMGGRQYVGALVVEHTSRIGEAICEGE
jgi:hypothetical protein